MPVAVVSIFQVRNPAWPRLRRLRLGGSGAPRLVDRRFRAHAAPPLRPSVCFVVVDVLDQSLNGPWRSPKGAAIRVAELHDRVDRARYREGSKSERDDTD